MEAIKKQIDATLRMIRAVKGMTRWEREAVAGLQRKTQGLFTGAIRSAIAELRKMDFVPGESSMQADIAAKLDAVQDQMRETVADASVDAGQHGRNRAVDDMRKAGVQIPDVPEMAEEIKRHIRDRAFEGAESTMRNLKGDVMNSLSKSYEDGLGIDDAARALRGKFDEMAEYRLRTIARTEIQGAQNDAAHDTIRELGGEYKQWITAEDDRVRGEDPADEGDHVRLHGEIAHIDTAFSNGLQYPGDRNGPIEEWINCRCREVPFIMPRGYVAPAGQATFHEGEIEKVLDA